MEQHAHQDANEFYYAFFDLLKQTGGQHGLFIGSAKFPGVWLISASSKVHPVSQVAKIL
jgi:hypothetical protein